MTQCSMTAFPGRYRAPEPTRHIFADSYSVGQFSVHPSLSARLVARKCAYRFNISIVRCPVIDAISMSRKFSALRIATSDRRALEGLPVEVAVGDLLRPASLAPALKGVEVLYHVAADYRLWAPDPAVLYRVNVDGTRSLLEAAATW